MTSGSGGGEKFPGPVRDLLARESILAMGRTAPNPAVACVLVVRFADHSEPRLFSGGTEVAGGRHAEIVALDAYDSYCAGPGRELSLQSAELFVSLEPCSHYGRTPPCVDRILRYPEIKTVQVLRRDVSLKEAGAEKLRRAGKTVIFREAEAEIARAYLAGFFRRFRGAGPRLHFKAAITLDGYISAGGDKRLMISGPGAKCFTQILRAKTDAVLVGPGTSALDLPGLELRPQDPGESLKNFLFQGDVFCDSIAANLSDLRTQLDEASEKYQGKRIFILGRPFEREVEFLEKQNRLSETTGKSSVYLCDGLHYAHWWDKVGANEIFEIPALQDPAFSHEIRTRLGEMGLNEVLVEGGAALFRALAGVKWTESADRIEAERDRFYILRNHALAQMRGVTPGPGALLLPSELSASKPRAKYNLGEDELWTGIMPGLPVSNV